MKNKLSKLSMPTMALAALLVVSTGFGVGALASADTVSTTAASTVATTLPASQGTQGHRGTPGIMGTVSAINGTTLTVSATSRKDSTTTTYTVDASNAKVMKSSETAATSSASTAPVAPTTISVSGIAVGDTVHIRGTVSGTNVTATDIMDGVMMGGPGGPGAHGGPHGTGGTITAINGSTITITNKSGTTYTVDASSAKLEKVSTISVSDLAVGDTIQADGTLSGTSITATHIMDGVMVGGPGGQAPTTSTTQN